MTVYIIEPLCHGNGGWYGTEILKELPTMEEALKVIPEWEPEYSPYSGYIINEPRLSPTNNINDAIFIFDSDEWGWRVLDHKTQTKVTDEYWSNLINEVDILIEIVEDLVTKRPYLKDFRDSALKNLHAIRNNLQENDMKTKERKGILTTKKRNINTEKS